MLFQVKYNNFFSGCLIFENIKKLFVFNILYISYIYHLTSSNLEY